MSQNNFIYSMMAAGSFLTTTSFNAHKRTFLGSTFISVLVLMLMFSFLDAYAKDMHARTKKVSKVAQTFEITSVSPAPGSIDVKWTGSVSVTFSNPIDPTTLSRTSFVITTSSGNPVVADTISYNDQTQTASFSPYLPFQPNSVYNVKVTTSIADNSQNHLDNDFTWSFTTAAVSMEALHVTNNKILDEDGNVMVFRGVNVPNPVEMYLWYTSHCNAEFFQAMADWNVKLIRIPVTCNSFFYFENQYGSGSCIRLLDWAVAWAGERGMYSIIDFHVDGYPPTGEWEHTPWDGTSIWGPLCQFTTAQMYTFWNLISTHFSRDKLIAFYDLFNEPAKDLPNGLTVTPEAWTGWRVMAESLIDSIRSQDPDRVVMVGGLDFAYDCSLAANDSVQRPNVVYSTHVYPSSLSPWFRSWDDAFGTLSASHPVLVGEVGFDPSDPTNTSVYGTDDSFGIPLIDNYLEPKGIGWLAWNFSPVWTPPLLTDWSYKSFTVSGSFFHDRLLANSAPFSPTLSLPVAGDTGVSTSTQLVWNSSAGATTYRLQVSVNLDFSTIKFDTSGIMSTSSIANNLVTNTTYYWRVKAKNAAGASQWSSIWRFTTSTSTFVKTDRTVPKTYTLYQNFPNPFNPTTIIGYDIPKLSHVHLVIYDILGRQIQNLVNEGKTPGHYQVIFDANDLPNGIYFYRLQAGIYSETKKLMVIK